MVAPRLPHQREQAAEGAGVAEVGQRIQRVTARDMAEKIGHEWIPVVGQGADSKPHITACPVWPCGVVSFERQAQHPRKPPEPVTFREALPDGARFFVGHLTLPCVSMRPRKAA